MDFKIGKFDYSMNIDKLSMVFDRIGSFNGTLTFLFFLINLVVAMHYTFVYNGLVDAGNTTDISILLIPILGLITSFLLCSCHNYSTNIKTISDILGMMLSVFCITLMFALIPIIGFKLDVLGISADYWDFTSHIIRDLLIYLIVFGTINFVIKAEIKEDEIDG